MKYMNQIDKIIELGTKLAEETDQNMLLHKILTATCKYTNAEGAVLYIIDEEQLVHRILYNQVLSVDKGYHNQVKSAFPKPISMVEHANMLPCHVALSGEMVHIQDVSKEDKFDVTYLEDYCDNKSDYTIQSILLVPMKNTEDEVVGVLQVYNARDLDKQIIPFTEDLEVGVKLLTSFSTMALSDLQHQQEVQRLMFSFCRVIVRAVEERTPYNASHTIRIVQILLGMLDYIEEHEWAREITGHFPTNRKEVLVMSLGYTILVN